MTLEFGSVAFEGLGNGWICIKCGDGARNLVWRLYWKNTTWRERMDLIQDGHRHGSNHRARMSKEAYGFSGLRAPSLVHQNQKTTHP